MKKQRKELEKELEAQSKQMIKELLDWNDSHPTPDMTQIEDIVLELRARMSQAMVASVLESQESIQPAEMKCPRCGGTMRYKGRKEKVVESRVGEVEFERGHYYCEECKAGIFPPGSAAEAGGEALE